MTAGTATAKFWPFKELRWRRPGSVVRLLTLGSGFLFLGMMINGAIAVACSLWLPLPDSMREVKASTWSVQEVELTGTLYFTQRVRANLGASETIAAAMIDGTNSLDEQYVFRAGAPFRSFYRVMHGRKTAGLCFTGRLEDTKPTSLRHGFLIPADMARLLRTRRDVIPVCVDWSGCLANTGVWAGAAAISFGGLRGLRIWKRMRRGVCPRCRYDLRSQLSSGCPECGWGREAASSCGDSR